MFLAFCAVTTPVRAASVIEFYNTNLDNYFITADAGEAAAIDNGSSGPGWSRTGNSFNSGGSTSVCRFYGSQSPGPNSHFYTADAGECAYLKQLQASTPGTQKHWNFESLDFVSTPPTNGACPTETVPVYRAYNNGSTRNVDSNHRISSSQTAIQEVVTRGWKNEGVVMCAPLCAALEAWNGTVCAAASTATSLTLIAGTADSPGSKDGTLLEASFNGPSQMSVDEQGNVYVADGCPANSRPYALYRKISPAGTVSTIAGSNKYSNVDNTPYGNGCTWGVTTHPDGNLYVSRSTRLIEKISPQGLITTVAGARGQQGSSDGVGATARFSGGGITADPQGNLFIADSENHVIRKIDPVGNVTTYAGATGVSGSVDGPLQSARFWYPASLKFGSTSGKLIISDGNGIRVISNGIVSTPITKQQLWQDFIGSTPLEGVALTMNALDVANDERIAVTYNNFRKVLIYRNNELDVGLGNIVGDADGAPSAAKFFFPTGLGFLPNGDLLISDVGNHNVKRYSATTNTVSLYAGKRYFPDPVDGKGSEANLYNPHCLVRSESGEIWFSEGGQLVRKIDAQGNVKAVTPLDWAMVAGCVVKVNDDGSFITSVNYEKALRQYGPTGDLRQTLSTQFDHLVGPTAVNATGDIFFTNTGGGISKYANGTVSEFAKFSTELSGLAFSKSGDLIASAWTGTGYMLVSVSPSGAVTTIAPAGPVGKWMDGTLGEVSLGLRPFFSIAVSPNGAIYVLSLEDNVIRRIYNGRVEIVVGTQWVNETTLGSGHGSLHDPREIIYDTETNSLIIMTNESILRAQLP